MVGLPLLCLVGHALLSARALSSMRLVSYNVHGWRDSNSIDSFERILQALRDVQPDVVCLQEVLYPYGSFEGAATYLATVRDGGGRGLDVPSVADADSYLRKLADGLGLPHVVYAKACDESLFGNMPFGNAICSRFPIAESDSIVMESTEADALLGNQKRDFADSRCAVWANITVGSTITVCTTHLDHKAEELRVKQMNQCLEALPNSAALVCGDFNTFQRSDHADEAWTKIVDFYQSRGWGVPAETSLVLDALRSAGFHDAHSLTPHGGSLPELTCWTHNPLFRIDHCFLSETLRSKAEVVDYRRLDSEASDHYALVLDFDIDES